MSENTFTKQSEHLSIAIREILTPAELEIQQLNSFLSGLKVRNADDCDIYFQHKVSEYWVLENSTVKEGAFNIEQGVGLRVVKGDKSGFAYSSEINQKAIQRNSYVAKSILLHGGGFSSDRVSSNAKSSGLGYKAYYSANNPLDSMANQEKVTVLNRIDAIAREMDPRVVNVTGVLAASYDIVLVNNEHGEWVADVRPLVRCGVTIMAKQGNRVEIGHSGGGGRYSYMELLVSGMIEKYVEKAVRLAVTNLDAVEVSAGLMPVVLGSGWPAVLLHEAVGHGLEGDFNRKGTSVFSGLLGEQVCSKLCTIVDDGTCVNQRGSLSMDDEGRPTQKTTLIENGILNGYMHDRMNARLMGHQATGNARRESYAHLPMPRMTNTYMLPGKSTPQEIISSVKKGLYAVSFKGGNVDKTSGRFVFSANEAYLIIDGKIGPPVKGVTLTGSGIDVMKRVSMVGNDLKFDDGEAICGKQGQTIPVGVGQPTLKIDEITVGGRK